MRLQRRHTGLRKDFGHGIRHAAAAQHPQQRDPEAAPFRTASVHQQDGTHRQHRTQQLKAVGNLPIQNHRYRQGHQQTQLLENRSQHHAAAAGIVLHKNKAAQIQNTVDAAHDSRQPQPLAGIRQAKPKEAAGKNRAYQITHGQHPQAVAHPTGAQAHNDTDECRAYDT